MHPLPIDSYVPQIQAALRQHQHCIISAAPGAGKSTRVLPALLDVCAGDVILLQPRRVAARSVARRIADEQGWTLGETVGYQVRFDRRGSKQTRLWVMTEGILARRLMSDPYLDGVSCVILDEFHERHIDSDIILSWCADLRQNLRGDLSLIVMSATMDMDAIHSFLPAAQCISVEGQEYPLHIAYKPAPEERRYVEHICALVEEASKRDDSGSILVFLPGVGEINNCLRILEERLTLAVYPLHGSLSLEQQEQALREQGGRRVVLATNIAETSVTVAGVRTVIDSGKERVAYQDTGSGLDQLRMQDISQFSATQRAGRAAREGKGRCLRVWSQAQHARKSESLQAEIHRVDLASYVLRLKKLHGANLENFPWFEPPQQARSEQAQHLLELLGFCESAASGGELTSAGTYVTELPLHPRLARVLLSAAADQRVSLGASIAAICSERDMRLNNRQHPYRPTSGDNDIFDRLDIFEYAQKKRFHHSLRNDGIDGRSATEVLRVRDDLLRTWGASYDTVDLDEAGIAQRIARYVLSAWPERVVRRGSASSNTGKMPAGKAVQFDQRSCLYARTGASTPAPLLSVAVAIQGLQRTGSQGNYVQLACAISEDDLRTIMPAHVHQKTLLRYDEKNDRVQAHVVWRYMDLDIKNAPDQRIQPEQISHCLAEGLAAKALTHLCGQETFRAWHQRLQCLKAAQPDWDLPLIDNSVAASILHSMADGCRSRADILKKNISDYLYEHVSRAQHQRIDHEAPTSITLASGRDIPLVYNSDPATAPVLAAKIQDCFGTLETPRIAGNRLPVIMHLLAPNRRPAQITSDLANFWKETYSHVRKDLRGRYPKHTWPENPHE